MKANMKIQNTSANASVDSSIGKNLPKADSETYQETCKVEEDDDYDDYDDYDDDDDEPGICSSMDNENGDIYIRFVIPRTTKDETVDDFFNIIAAGAFELRNKFKTKCREKTDELLFLFKS